MWACALDSEKKLTQSVKVNMIKYDQYEFPRLTDACLAFDNVELIDFSQRHNELYVPSNSWSTKMLYMRKTTRLKSGWGFGQTNSPLSTARVLIDAVGLCLLRVSEVWQLFAQDLRRWINSFSGSDFKPRLVYKTWYFCFFFTNFDHQF